MFNFHPLEIKIKSTFPLNFHRELAHAFGVQNLFDNINAMRQFTDFKYERILALE